MLDLSSLWKLEKNHESLYSMKNEMKLLQERTEFHKLEKKCQELEERHENLLIKMKEVRLHLRKLEQEVDTHKEKSRMAELTLYNGSVKDLKQLEHLEKEKEYHRNLIDVLEDKIIDSMGISEDTESRIDEIYRLLSESKGDLVEKQNLIDESSAKLKNGMEVLEKTIENLEGEIDGARLSKYNDIRKRKGSGIAEMKNDVCNGCHMHIPEKIVEKARQGKAVVTCENCGRILYGVLEQEDI
ncbi:MAG: C4-type zinc ribbon domain-containing protein [Gudongella sp.]|nr:C4-type zinc ribbon domain-containing protein [Gudongella sp.]